MEAADPVHAPSDRDAVAPAQKLIAVLSDFAAEVRGRVPRVVPRSRLV
jgi:hypothetical protein